MILRTRSDRFFRTRFPVIVAAGFVVLLSVAAVTEARAGDCKVGIIDTTRIVIKSEYGQKMRAEFADEMEDQRRLLERKRADAEQQRERLIKAKEDGKNAETLKELEDALEKTVRELKWMKEDLDKDLLETDKELQERMKQRVLVVLNRFIAATDYCIIIEKHRVAAFSESVDVTDDFIKWLDSYKE